MRAAALGAMDIQRARDHGLTDYNSMRASFGLDRVSSFAAISSDVQVQAALATVYEDVDSIVPSLERLLKTILRVPPLSGAGSCEILGLFNARANSKSATVCYNSVNGGSAR